jgi:cystathionine beta-lyase/cystathionine gamma-synthase
VDVRAVARIAQNTSLLAADNTFSSPILPASLTQGADVVIPIRPKYQRYSDVIGGALITKDASLHAHYAFYQNAVGAVPGAFDCWAESFGPENTPPSG